MKLRALPLPGGGLGLLLPSRFNAAAARMSIFGAASLIFAIVEIECTNLTRVCLAPEYDDVHR